MDEMNVVQIMFAAMWEMTEGSPLGRKMLVSAAEEYNRRMAEINGKA